MKLFRIYYFIHANSEEKALEDFDKIIKADECYPIMSVEEMEGDELDEN